ncbi:hypothetical protein RRSWK_03812 [Rhodopirellula sp. SWK7]|nr:hypothetical protein RRSWK_03812 [Rhodopirellula sp. SWK7]
MQPSSAAFADQHRGASGVSEYQITEHLPDDLRSSLPTIEQIKAEF